MRQRLAKVLASLTGPVTEQAQRSFLQDLKVSFRQRIQHEAAPVAHVVDRHLQSVLQARPSRVRLPSPAVVQTGDVQDLARRHFIEGTLTPATVRSLLSAATTHEQLLHIQHWALRAGPATDIERHPDLAAKLAGKLLTLGLHAEAAPLITRHAKAFIADSAHHALILFYAAERDGLQAALSWQTQLETEPRYRRGVWRTLLRAAVRQNQLEAVRVCLAADLGCAFGQETGLARWLCAREAPEEAFAVLQRADPRRAKEAAVGLAIAEQLVQGTGESLVLCRQVLNWTEGLYVLSVQEALKRVERELDQKLPPPPPPGSSRKRQRESASLPNMGPVASLC